MKRVVLENPKQKLKIYFRKLKQSEMKDAISTILNRSFAEKKFRTFASLFRKHIEPYFDYTATLSYQNMSFSEWASYYIGDGDYYIESQADFENFIIDAYAKNLVSQEILNTLI